MRDNGFIKLSRKFFTNDIWKEARTFSSCEAWLYLIQAARFDAEPVTRSIGGREITWERGQYPASIRFLSKEWDWSEKRVRIFLDRLKKKGMIKTSCTQGVNIITLCKYDDYNSSDNNEDTSKGTDNELSISKINDIWAQLRAQQGHSEGTIYKKEKNIINPPYNSPLSIHDKITALQFKENSLGNDLRIEEYLMAFKCTKTVLDTLIDEYVNDQIAKGNYENTENEYRKHFVNWSKIKLKNERKEPCGQSSKRYRKLD